MGTTSAVTIDQIASDARTDFDSLLGYVERDVLKNSLLPNAVEILAQKGLDINCGLQKLADNYMGAYHAILGFRGGRPHSYTVQEKMQIARALEEFYQEQLEGPFARGEIDPRLAGRTAFDQLLEDMLSVVRVVGNLCYKDSATGFKSILVDTYNDLFPPSTHSDGNSGQRVDSRLEKPWPYACP